MTPEENKALVRRLIEEAWNTGNPTLLEELVAIDFVDHSHGQPGDRERLKRIIGGMRTPFPDFHTSIEDMIAEGDKVVARLRMQGTHQGEFLGVPATGKQVTWRGTVTFRIADGKVVECWADFDHWGLRQELGPIPSPSSS